MPFAKIIGTGGYLPGEPISNDKLAQQLAKQGIETSHQWIVERTGIEFRHFATAEQNASDLALPAAKQALANAGLTAQDVDLIIVATSTPDKIFPSTASIVQHKLGISGCPAFDVQAVCSGFLYALTVADAMIRTGSAKNALVIGAEVFSGILDFTDRSTCVLFGDGAGAMVLAASQEPGILATALHADGGFEHILNTPGTVRHGAVCGHPFLTMNGKAVFRLAIKVLEEAAIEVMGKANFLVEQLDWLVPHQANIRIMQNTAKKLNLSMDKMIVTVDKHGNTSAASVPLALHYGFEQGYFKPQQTLLLEGVGGGFTWGAALVRI